MSKNEKVIQTQISEEQNFSYRTCVAIVLAKKAGYEIKRIIREEDLKIKEKGIKDVLTVADASSEKIITTEIKKIFPNDTIIAEEGGIEQNGNSNFTWAIDPLDGTINFSRKIPFYCVSIGYMKDKVPEGGAIYIPETDELFVCERGKGAYCNGKRIHVSNVSTMEKSLATIGFNNRYKEMVTWFNKIHSLSMVKLQNVEKLFSTVISLCYVASGRTEAHMEMYCFLWDICVGTLLVEEAGGKVSTILSEKIDYSQIEKQSIVASNGIIYEKFAKIIKDSK